MSETKVPALPAVSDTNLTDVVRAVKQTLDVREGRLGDPLDAYITYRDLVNIGSVVVNPAGTRSSQPVIPVGSQPDGYDPTTDYTQPPAPAGFTVTGGFAIVQLQWNAPAIRNLAYTEVWRAETNAIGDAVRIGTSDTRFYTDSLGSSATRYYWARHVSQADVEGPYNATLGTAGTTATNPALVLASLSGQISASELNVSLNSRINLVDAPATTPNSVNARIAVVQGQVNDLLNIPTWDSSNTYATNDQVTYGGSLYLALQASTNVTPTNTAYWQKIGDYTSLGDAVAAHTTQIASLDDGLGQEITDRQALAVQLRGSYTGNDLSLVSQGLIYQERTARATAVSAISSEVTTLSALVNTKTKVYYQSTAPANSPVGTLVVGDLWIDTNITYYNDYASGDYVIRSNKQYRWNGTAWVEAIDYGFADWFTAINTEKTSRISADSALSASITSLTSLANSNTAAIQSEATTRANADTALSTSITTLNSQVNNASTGLPATRALLISDYYTKTATDSAISSASTTLTAAYLAADSSTLTSAQGYVQSYSYSKAQTDSAISTSATTLTATINTKDAAQTAALQSEATVRASADNSLFAQYTVKTDLAGRVSGFGLASTSTVAGGSTSAFAIVADRFSISAPNDYTQEATPTSGVTAGKVWYKPSTNQTFRYDGSTWVAFSPVSPFIVRTTPTTANGVAVPAGIYMDAAYIQDGTITNAKIANAAIDNAKIANLDAAKITTGYISADRIDAGTIDAKILTVAAAKVTGTLTANQINGAGLTITGGSLTGYLFPTNGAKGFYLGPNGLLLGNSYAGAGQAWGTGTYFQYDQSTGSIYTNGLSIVNGNATFSGNLAVTSAQSGARMEITNSVIRVIDAGGVVRVKIGYLL